MVRSIGDVSKGINIEGVLKQRDLGADLASGARTKIEAMGMERRDLALEYFISPEDKT